MKKVLIALIVFLLIVGKITFAQLFDASGKVRDTEAIIPLDAIKTAMEMYAADNGFYPKGIKTLEALKTALGNDCPTNVKMDGSNGSLVAATTNPEGTQFRLYSVGSDENYCYGVSQDGKIIGPDILSKLISQLGPPLPENTVIVKKIVQGNKTEKPKPNNLTVLAEIKQDAAIYTKETELFKDEKIGIFKISLSRKEMQGNNPDSLVPVFDDENIFGVYPTIKIQDIQLKEMQRITGQSEISEMEFEKFPEYKLKMNEINRLPKELQQMRTEKEFSEDQKKYFETLMENAKKKNEPYLAEEGELNYHVKNIKNLESKIKILSDKSIEQWNELKELKANLILKIKEEEIICTFYGRFKKQGEVILKINNSNTGKNILAIKLTLPETNGGNKLLLQSWQDAQKNYLTRMSSVTSEESIFPYILEQTPLRLGFEKKADSGRSDRTVRNRPQNIDMYSITTGALAIQESLQLDRMTGTTGKKFSDEVPIEKLTGPQVKSHPFTEMLGGREPGILPIDALIPEEFYYFHFSDINKEIEFSDLLDQWGTSLLNVMKVSSHDAQLKQKYLRQLCLELSVLTRLFGDKVIDDLAIVGNDPFLHEGTDISVIFNVKNKPLFDTNVSKYIEEAKKNFPDVKESDITYGQNKIHAVVSPDRTVSSYSCYLDTFKVYSNSKKAIEEIIDTYEKKHPSLALASDFQYMRTIFPADKSKEDAFLYLSESCIRKLVGPRWKIERKRRMECNNSLCMINNAVSMYYMEKNTGVPVLKYLLENHFIEQEYLLCPDGGNYSIDKKSGEPFCDKHGRMRYLIPITELQLPLVTKMEQEEYGKFVEEYNRYWSRFFDPVGIRVKFDDKKIKVETCILPLIENSIYNGFKAFSGGEPVKINSPEAKGTILQLFSKLNLSKENFKTDKINYLTGKTSFSTDQILNIIGDSIGINVIDSSPMFSFDLTKGGPMLSGFLRDQTQVMAASFVFSAITMPTYITISVKDEEKAAQFVHELIQSWVKENAYLRMKGGGNWFGVYGYQVSPDYKGYTIETLDVELLVLRMRLHFMVYKNNIFIANQRDILTGIIDNPEKITNAETNLMLRINSSSFDRMSEINEIGWLERIRKVCINNLGSIYALNKLRGISLDKVNEASLAINGYTPYCPSGGKYGYDKDRDTIYCTIHGDIQSPKQPFKYEKDIPLNKFISSLKNIETSLKFTPEGIMTELTIDRGGKEK